MRFAVLISALLLFLFTSLAPALAWWDEGHMQIAYLAYKRLDPAVKDRVDALLKLNPDYSNWICGAPDEATAKLYAFVHAATWADDIKTKADYTNDNVHDPNAGQNIGYSDHHKHAFWHFKDILFSPDETHLPTPDPVDAVTQLKLMIAALPASSGASDDLRSYDLAWTLHLAGDIHQPLHTIGRYTAQIPNGDRGGNAEMVVPATGETIALHAYWDRIFGGYSSAFGAVFDADESGGLAGLTPDPDAARISDPAAWAQESFELAKKFAYAAPISNGTDAVLLTREYETNARNTARSQAALAAARLANLLNETLASTGPSQSSAPPDRVTLCTTVDLCYCVNKGYRDKIEANVVRVRRLIADSRQQGRAIGYLSVPISPAGGGYSPYNVKAAGDTAADVEARFGTRAVWILNPAAEGSKEMEGASGADYMYMWTTILEGPRGNGEDFDFFYFAGPSDFAKSFKLPAVSTLEALDDYFDARVKDDTNFKKAVDSGAVTKAGFRNYYGLRAEVSFSLGSHDEWNIARILNERRRGVSELGIPNQIALFFDGKPVTPGGYESPAASGDVGRCIK